MTSDSGLLPWQKQQFAELIELAASRRLGHAWLLTGVQGIGKLGFAQYLARSLFCQQPDAGQACGSCSSCHLFSVGTHPDWRLLQPEKKLITIDQVREAIDFAHNKSQRGSYKILCVSPAEAMNNNAANALLKLLEEPPAGTLLFLVSHQPGMLLPTLRSRCQLLRMTMPSTETAKQWLEVQGYTGDAEHLLHRVGGAPLQALAMTESGLLAEHETILACLQELLGGTASPVKAARKCEKISIEATIDYLMQILAAMLRDMHVKQTSDDAGLDAGLDVEINSLLALLPEGRDESQRLRILHRFYQSLGAVRKTLMSSNNPNPLLILEQVFGDWSKLRNLAHTRGGNLARQNIRKELKGMN